MAQSTRVLKRQGSGKRAAAGSRGRGTTRGTNARPVAAGSRGSGTKRRKLGKGKPLRARRGATAVPFASLMLTVTLALLAYAYLLAFPTLALIFLGRAVSFAIRQEWLVVLGSASICVAFALITYRLARLRPEPPAEIELSESRVPKLFRAIERARAQFNAPHVDRVLIDHSLGVQMVYTPRNGFPFYYSCSLVLGLAAMQLLSPLHFEGLIARRFGQSSRRNNRATGWLTALRFFGPGLLQACSNWRRVENIVVRVFFLWYTPLYRRCSVKVARADELHGDQYMGELVNDRDAAELIAAQVIAERYLEERYLPAIMALARKSPNPSPVFYCGIERKFNRYWTSPDAKRWLQRAFATQPDRDDPWPSLRSRLAAIEHHNTRLPSPLDTAASRAFLGDALKQVVKDADRAWTSSIALRWQDAHHTARKESRRMGMLHQKSRKQTLDAREAIALAALVERYHNADKAAPFYKNALRQHGSDAGVNYAAGRFLLATGDRRGISALERAGGLDKRYAKRATARLEEYRAELERDQDAGASAAVSETQMPIFVSESPQAVSGTAIRKAVSEFGETGSVGDQRQLEAIASTGPKTAAGDASSGLGGAISETGLRGAAAIESGLGETASRTGLPVVAMEKRAARTSDAARAGKPAGAKPSTPAGSADDLAETDIDQVLAMTGTRTSVTAARVQTALTDSAIRKAISDQQLNTAQRSRR